MNSVVEPEHLRSELAAWLDAALERHRVPGAAAFASSGGALAIVTAGARGVLDARPVSERTVFRWGSITKTVTATAVMRLVERGDLDLDAPARRFVPEYAPGGDGDAVTLRHCLTHTAGFVTDVEPAADEHDLAALARRVAGLPRVAPPGEVASYNNAQFLLAGRAVEVAAGKPFAVAARELVLEPLRLDATMNPAVVMTGEFALGHVERDGALVTAVPWSFGRGHDPAGGACGHVADLARYAVFHAGDGVNDAGERVLAAATMALMRAPAFDAALEHARGVSWNVQDVNGVRFVGHTGGTVGHWSRLSFVPERGLAWGVVTNANGGQGLVAAFNDWARSRLAGVTKAAPADAAPLPAASLEAFAGVYVGANASWSMRASVVGDALECRSFEADGSASAEEPLRVAVYDERGHFLVLSGPAWARGKRAEFVRDRSGRVRWLRWAGRVVASREA